MKAGKNESKQFVAYYRVSTKEQGESGLGLDAQRQTVQSQVAQRAGEVIAEYTEVASGKRRSRRQLEAALSACRATGASLVVAKLDRLSRVAFQLLEIRDALEAARIGLLICDKPNMGLIEFSIYAAFAQDEREKISQRTKAALAARERKTGLRNGAKKGIDTRHAVSVAVAVRKENAMLDENNKIASNVIRLELAKGSSYRKIAEYLNEIGLKTVKGKCYTVSTVQHLVGLYGLKADKGKD